MLDRSKFKPTSTAAVKERDAEVGETGENGYENRIPRFSVKGNANATYKIRMYPANPEKPGSLSIEPITTNFLPYMRPKRSEDKKTVIKDAAGNVVLEKSVIGVFNAKTHGKAKHDLVETFIDEAEKMATNKHGEDKDAKAKFLAPIYGNAYNGGTFKGIAPSNKWRFYGDVVQADDSKTFHEVEVGKAVKNGISKTAAVESSDDPLGTDGCFTDIEDGRLMKIIVDKTAGAKNPGDYYTVSIDNSTVEEVIQGKKYKLPKLQPLSDEDLEKLMKAPALVDYRTAFKNRDLELQVKGLELFVDEFPQFQSIINSDEFQEVFATLAEMFPKEEKDEDGVPEATGPKSQEPSGDKFDIMDLAELKVYAKANCKGMFISKSVSEEDLRSMIREFEEADEDVDTTDEGTVPENEETTSDDDDSNDDQPEAEEKPTGSTTDRLSRLRNKNNA